MTSRFTIAACIGLLCAASAARSQTGGSVTVNGLAYDSLHARPLGGAFVVMVGTSRSAMSDSLGRFQFDSVAPGKYRFVMQHDVLDTIGLSGVAAQVTIASSADTVRVSVPSFTTMWHAACAGPTAPGDSGFIFGTVRVPAGMRLPPAVKVSASWLDMGVDRSNAVKQKRWRLEAVADSNGNYTMCGVPLSTGLRMWAMVDSSASGLVDLMPLNQSRVIRRDLLLGAPNDSTARGTIAGLVTGEGGKAVRDAVVVSEGHPEVRTDPDGRFIMRDVPAGTQQLEVRAIGAAPVLATVDVIARDTVNVSISLAKVTVLDSVRVNAKTSAQHFVDEYESRKKRGLGRFIDSTTISTRGTLNAVFGSIPSVTVRSPRGRPPIILLPSYSIGGGGYCLANVFVDGVKIDQTILDSFRPDDIAAMEIYVRATDTPAEFMTSIAARRCGTVVIWTKSKWP